MLPIWVSWSVKCSISSGGTAPPARTGCRRRSAPLKESTVRTVLKRLEGKGHLTHRVDQRTFVYEAADTRGRAAARAVKRIVDRFCSGSLEEVLVGLVDTRILDRARVAAARREDRARAQTDAGVTRRKK